MAKRLAGQVALVTGGGRGLGRGIAEGFGAEGANVVVNYMKDSASAEAVVAKINAAGVKIVLGTDGNRAWGPHEEAEDMVVAGMTPMQVIIAATKNAAEFLKMTDTGTLSSL